MATKRRKSKKTTTETKEPVTTVKVKTDEESEETTKTVERKTAKTPKKTGKKYVMQVTEEDVFKRTPNTYRKKGGGALYLKIGGKTRIIKPNQVFEAFPEDLPENFIDTLVLLKEGKEVPVTKEMLEKAHDDLIIPTSFEKVSIGDNLFDIVDKNGKKMNEESLTEEEADSLIKALS